MPSFVCRIKANQHSHNLQDIGCVCHGEAKKQARCVASGSAFWLFGAGIVGTGLLAVPVLTPDRQRMQWARRWRWRVDSGDLQACLTIEGDLPAK